MVPHARVYQPELCGTLSDNNKHRLERVLRMRPGDSFIITDGLGQEAVAILGKDGSYEGKEWVEPGREPEVEVTLFAAISKGDRLEWLIEKAVEMGVKRIVPLIGNRCVVKKPSTGKVARWRKVALTAMIQCGGCCLPEVSDPIRLTDIETPAEEVLPILLHEEPLSVSLKELPAKEKKQIWLASGPEGGFDDSEVDFFLKNNWKTVWMGKRLFKTDTAPTIALSCLLADSWGTK
jgi:16S rRNA (uracil1498-N3)-methyltransferase